MFVIWNNSTITIDDLNKLSEGTMGEHLAITFTEIGHNYLKANMPVGPTVLQPYGLLHGGASAALAETVGSMASYLVINKIKQLCVGIEINCNHVRSVREGIVVATAEPLHLGASTHVWDIRIKDERERLICVSRLTVAILPKK
jgi:1,4-dihydroxy-2-naphthoyl-CoA hydrolase